MLLAPIRYAAKHLRTHPLLGRLALLMIPDVRWTIRIEPIGRFRVFLRRNRAYWLRHPLTHERFALSALSCLIHPGDTVLDIGANIGLYVRFMAQHFGAGRVLAFEPITANRELLVQNVALGGVTERVQVFAYAIADRCGQEEFQVDDMMSETSSLDRVTHGEASLGRRNLGLPPKVELVECRTLDGLLEQGTIGSSCVIKLDIEGAETMAIEGARKLLAQKQVRLVVELHGAEQARDVISLLLDAGYHMVASVASKLHAEGFGPLCRDMLKMITERYDVSFLIAVPQGHPLPTVRIWIKRLSGWKDLAVYPILLVETIAPPFAGGSLGSVILPPDGPGRAAGRLSHWAIALGAVVIQAT